MWQVTAGDLNTAAAVVVIVVVVYDYVAALINKASADDA